MQFYILDHFTEIKPPPPIKQENSHGIVKTEVKQEVPETTTTTSVGGARLKEEDYDSSTTVYWKLLIIYIVKLNLLPYSDERR